MEQNLENVERWPYPAYDYVLRILWGLIRNSLWKVAWHRFGFLRMLILRIFGAQVNVTAMAYGSTNILRPWNVKLGRRVALGPGVKLYNLSKIEIGDNTVISQDAYLCGGTHDYTSSVLPLLRKDIIVKSNVWICAGAFIGPGVTIGEGSVIGARSVVLKDVAPWSVVGGNPAKFIKTRIIKC